MCLYTMYIKKRTTMATRNPETEALLPEPINKFKSRELRWLWSYLVGYGRLDQADRTPPPPYKSLSQSRRAHIMGNAIKRDENSGELVNRIISCLNDELVPEEELKWIDKENHRLLIWCINNLHLLVPKDVRISHQPPERLPRMPYLDATFADIRHEEIIVKIDIWSINREEKLNFLLEKKNEWTRYKTPDKQIKWINQEDEVQLVWAWEYLENHRKDIRVPKPANMMEYYAAVLASLDDMSYGHPSDKKLFMEQMKRTWSQKKFRDSGKAKKPYYLPLTLNTKEKLEWLAENSGQKPADILEQLILENYSKAKKGE